MKPISSGTALSYIIIAAIFTAVGALASNFYFRHKAPNYLNEVIDLIEKSYVDTVNIEKLQRNTIPLILRQLDPHSVYLSKSDNEFESEALNGAFYGVGITFNALLDSIVVTQVAEDGPSERAGIRPGDRLLKVGSQILHGEEIDFDNMAQSLRGKKGSVADILISRNGQEKLFHVVRDEVPIPSISSHFMISPGVGYIRIDKWAGTTHAEFLDALGFLSRENLSSLILDLRENGGGLLEASIELANEFLKKDLKIVLIEGKAYPREEILSNGKGILQNMPLVVLVDEQSASSSEVFSGAMQDHDRAKIIGRRTFGKGLVQLPFDLKDGSSIRLTVARYYTPSGRSIQKPYSSGENEEYFMDIINRYNHGEMHSADSIPKGNDKVFKTDNGRKVYAKGGITPDIFIPIDNRGMNSYMMKVEDANLIPQYAFLYSDANRSTLSQYKTIDDLLNHLEHTYLIYDFASFAKQKGIPMRTSLINEARERIDKNINAYIVMNFFGLQGYYEVILRDDPFIRQALTTIEEWQSDPINYDENRTTEIDPAA